MAINVHDDEIWMKLRTAYQVAYLSDDCSTRNGALLVSQGWNVLSGHNHMMPGWGKEACHHERPFKYWVTEHAERDVLLKATRLGYKTEGLTLVANWVACADCARAIVLAGIACVICHKQCQDRTPERWREQIDVGLSIIKRDCDLIEWDGAIGGIDNLNNGEVWYP